MIVLAGAPEVVLADADALGPAAEALLAALGLPVHTDVGHVPTLAVPSVGLFVHDRPEVVGCHAWWVGPGPHPTWMHPTDGGGAATSARVLALLGTGFAQERAGAAFRAAGAGSPAPTSTPYDAAGILSGITAAVAPVVARARTPRDLEDVGDVDALLRHSFHALDRCCAANGAIAASPARPDGPDYWFFWQRDAAHVAHALHLLGLQGPDDLRAAAGDRARAWARFVSDLGPRLAATEQVATSRCSMTGEPVGGYGDPQHDGPAATALVLLTVVPEPRAALAAARPYLDHLLGPVGPGYDLWELVRGRSFHAEHLRARALARAADLAERTGDPLAARWRVASAAAGLADFGQGAHVRHVLDPDPPWFDLLSGIDASTVGAVLLAAPTDEPLPELGDPGVAAVVEALVAHSARRGSDAVVRFPEDTNDGLGSTGGRPWPVATLWVAQWFLRQARLPRARDARALRARGLRHLHAVLASDVRALGEQLDWQTAEARGARPVAWSHAELVTTLLLL